MYVEKLLLPTLLTRGKYSRLKISPKGKNFCKHVSLINEPAVMVHTFVFRQEYPSQFFWYSALHISFINNDCNFSYSTFYHETIRSDWIIFLDKFKIEIAEAIMMKGMKEDVLDVRLRNFNWHKLRNYNKENDMFLFFSLSK